MPRLFPLLLVPLLAAVALLPAADPPKAKPPGKGTNYAFLIGCAGYDKTELQPIKDDVTVNDVIEFKKALNATGFKDAHIVMMHDQRTDARGRYLPEYAKIVKELDLFLDGLTNDDTVVVVLSGHGVHFKGDKTGHFCPVDAKISTKKNLLPMDGAGGLYPLLEKCKAGRKLLIANACRNDPASSTSLAGGKIELVDDYPETVPQGIAAIFSCDVGQKSYFDPDRKRSLFMLHMTEAWKTGGNLEDVFKTTDVNTKADARKTFGEKQFPVVKRVYEGEWMIKSTLAAFRQYPRLGMTAEQKRELKGRLDEGKRKAGDLKTDEERTAAYLELGTLAHHCGESVEADAMFGKGITSAKQLLKQEEYYGSEVERLVEALAWCGRVREADAVVAVDTGYSRHNKARAVIKGLCLAGEYGEAWKRCGASDDRQFVESARFDLLGIAREMGDFDVVYAGAAEVVRDGGIAGNYGSNLASLYRAERSLPLAFSVELRKARGDDACDRMLVGLIGDIRDSRNLATGLFFATWPKSTTETKSQVREKLPTAIKLAETDGNLATHQMLLVTALQVDDLTIAKSLDVKIKALLAKQATLKVASGHNDWVVDAWARYGDLERAKKWAALDDPKTAREHADHIAVAYAAHLFSKGQVDEALEQLGTASVVYFGTGEVYRTALESKATDRLWTWLRSRPRNTNEERKRCDLQLESFAIVAISLGDTAEALAWLGDDPNRPLLYQDRNDFGRALVRAGKDKEGAKWLKAKPSMGVNEMFVRNQLEEQIRNAKR